MRNAGSVRLSNQGLRQVEEARVIRGWKRQEQQWFELADVSKSTLRRCLEGKKYVDANNVQKICSAVGLQEVEIINISGQKQLMKMAALEPSTSASAVPPPKKSGSLSFPEGSNELCIHNLPEINNEFIGRDQEISQLIKYLSPSKGISIISITGIGGVGKTALAIQAAYKCIDNNSRAQDKVRAIIFFSAKRRELTSDGLYHRATRYKTLDDILRVISKILGEQSITQESDSNLRIEKAYEALSKHRTILILDNLESIEGENIQEIKGFIYGTPTGVKTLITSREQPFFDSLVLLDPLSYEESKKLIWSKLHGFGSEVSNKIVEKIYTLTSGIPLAIMYTVGRLQGGLKGDAFKARLEYVLQDMSDASGDLCQFCFGKVFSELNEGSESLTEASQILMSLSIFPGGASRSFLANAVGFDVDELKIDISISKLLGMSLINYNEKYYMHGLTREYTLSMLRKHKKFRNEIRLNQIQSYLKFTKKYGIKDWGEWHEKYDRIESEWSNILGILNWCKNRESEHFDSIVALWKNVNNFADLYGHWGDRVDWLSYLNNYAASKGDMIGLRFYSYSRLLWTYTMQLDYSSAQSVAAKASKLVEEAEKSEQESFYHHLTVLYIRLRNYDEALKSLEKSKSLLRSLEESGGFSDADLCRRKLNSLYNLGKIFHHRDSDYIKADNCYREVIRGAGNINWRRGLSYAYYWLSESQIDQNLLEEASHSISIGLPIATNNNHRRRVAYYHYALARLFLKRGDKEKAGNLLQEAIEQFSYLNLTDGKEILVSEKAIRGDLCEAFSKLSSIIYPWWTDKKHLGNCS